MTTSPSLKDLPKPIQIVAAVGGAVVGWAVAHYAGMYLWMMAALNGLLLIVFTKTPLRPRFFVGAITTTTSYVIGFVFVISTTHSWSTVPDMLILIIAVAWLWFSPNLAAVAFLGVAHLVALAVHVFVLNSSVAGSSAQQEAIAQCFWRIFAIVCLVVGYVRFRRHRALSISSTASS
jgi:hypothetical protein